MVYRRGLRSLADRYQRSYLLQSQHVQRISCGEPMVKDQCMPFKVMAVNHPVWRYKLMNRYRQANHYQLCARRERWTNDYLTIHGHDNAVVLQPRYAWRGRKAMLSSEELRASAIYDAHCQGAMRGAYRMDFRFRCLLAAEYFLNCVADGMPRWRAGWCYLITLAKTIQLYR